jgi:hypothetical protein
VRAVGRSRQLDGLRQRPRCPLRDASGRARRLEHDPLETYAKVMRPRRRARRAPRARRGLRRARGRGGAHRGVTSRSGTYKESHVRWSFSGRHFPGQTKRLLQRAACLCAQPTRNRGGYALGRVGGLGSNIEDRSELSCAWRLGAELLSVGGDPLLSVHWGSLGAGLFRARWQPVSLRSGCPRSVTRRALRPPESVSSRSGVYVTRRVPFIPLSTWPGIVQMYL